MTEYRLARSSGWAPVDDGLAVVHGTWFGIVRGEAALAVRDDLAVSPGRVVERPETRRLLEALASRGVLHEGAAQDASYRTLLGTGEDEGPPDADRPPGRPGVLVMGKDDLADTVAGVLAAELAAEGMAVTRQTDLTAFDPPAVGCAVVVAGSEDAGELPRLDRRFHETSQPWVLLDARGLGPPLVGPLFVPGETGCLDCHWSRRASASGRPDAFEEILRRGRSAGRGAWERNMVAGLAAALTLGWVLARNPWLPGASFEVALDRGPALRRHAHQPLRGCPRCAGAGASLPRERGEVR